MTMDWMLPVERGFNTSMGYLGGGEDHYTQAGMIMEWGCTGTDLWLDRAGARCNGTYGGFLYNDAAVQIIEEHPEPEVNPLFIYLATQTMHAPVEVPSHYSDMYAAYTKTYAVSNGMVTVTDEILRNVTAALTKRGMWARTLIIHLSDKCARINPRLSPHFSRRGLLVYTVAAQLERAAGHRTRTTGRCAAASTQIGRGAFVLSRSPVAASCRRTGTASSSTE